MSCYMRVILSLIMFTMVSCYEIIHIMIHWLVHDTNFPNNDFKILTMNYDEDVPNTCKYVLN